MTFTDHKSIKLKFELEEQKKRPNFWKFNNSFLSDTKFTEGMNALLNEKWRENDDIDDIRIRYELLKFEIQQFSMKYGKQKAKIRRKREKELIQIIEQFEKKIEQNTLTETENTDFISIKTELENLLIYKSKGEEIRSKTNFIEQNEKSTAYFFNQTKTNYERKTIDKLQNKDGKITMDDQEINAELKSFYENLYSSKLTSATENLWQNPSALKNLPKLSNQTKDILDNNITIEELHKALKDLTNKKSPGVDGLTAEFYKSFFHILGPILLDTLNYSRNNGQLPISLRRAVITLLQKKAKALNI